MGVALGCGVGVFICTLALIIICCCGLKHCAVRRINNEYMEEIPEKAVPVSQTPPPISATSPEVIMMMEESPRAIRKHSDPRYMTHPPPAPSSSNNSTPTVLFSPAASNSHYRGHHYYHSPAITNPTYTTTGGEMEYEQPLTPPVFQGRPAPPF